MELNKIYFYTATIEGWKHLLKKDKFKDIIIDSLKYLSDKELINVYAFVIMPNHLHIIWEMVGMNGKELPHASFMKFTSHQFRFVRTLGGEICFSIHIRTSSDKIQQDNFFLSAGGMHRISYKNIIVHVI